MHASTKHATHSSNSTTCRWLNTRTSTKTCTRDSTTRFRTPPATRTGRVQRRVRLDAELVRRGFARSREHAAELIAAGRVLINGAPAAKPATAVRGDESVYVDEPARQYASRGGDKIAPVLAQFTANGLVVSGKRCLDAGASTGGFTDVLLTYGAASV